MIIGATFEAVGAGATTPRVVLAEFPSWQEASMYFSDIYRHGDGITKSTQDLLKMKKIS